jgi:phage gpG-like protein
MIGDKELGIYLGRVANSIKPQLISGLNEIGNHLEEKVKDKFGKYQSGWPKLKRASVIAKYKSRALKGMKARDGSMSFITTGGDDPLLLSGQLRDSIQKDVKSGALEVEIFSDNIYSAVHEYGYKHVPSRSYMRLTLSQEEEEVEDIIDRNIGRII